MVQTPSSLPVEAAYVIPLPHEIAVERRHHTRGVRILALGDGAAAAAAELEAALPADNDGLLIVVGLVTPDGLSYCATGSHVPPPVAQRLSGLPNSDQAYSIDVHTEQDEPHMHICALEQAGLFYGALTLTQLCRPALATNTDAGVWELPLPHVVDWPDTEERGVWNGPETEAWIRWKSALKLNYGNQQSVPSDFVRGEPVTQKMQPQLMAKAALRGFRYVPQIGHLNFLSSQNLFGAYPELAGRGDAALGGRYFAHNRGPVPIGDQHRCPVPGHPKLIELLSEWMEHIASECQETGCRQELACWLTERPCYDDHPETKAVGQFVLEARAFVEAWERARQRFPALTIRLFLSTTTPQRDDVVVAEAPPEVKLLRCCITDHERSANQPRDLFGNPTLDNAVEEGRWLGSYDVPLTCNGRVETPMFKLPHRSAHRIYDFVQQMVARGYAHLCGMMGWHFGIEKVCGLNIGYVYTFQSCVLLPAFITLVSRLFPQSVTHVCSAISRSALAEFSWNANGRTPSEFAFAWALREGMNEEKAQAFVQWHEMVSPIEWDIYDSAFPTSYNCPWYVDGPLPHQPGLSTFLTDRLYPTLGVGPFRYFDTVASFVEKARACDTACSLAREQLSHDPTIAEEAEVAASYVQLLGNIYAVLLLRAQDECATAKSLREMSERVAAVEEAGARNVAAIKAWRRDISIIVSGSTAETQELEEASWAQRVHDAVSATQRTVGDIVQFCRHSLGTSVAVVPGLKSSGGFNGPRARAEPKL